MAGLSVLRSSNSASSGKTGSCGAHLRASRLAFTSSQSFVSSLIAVWLLAVPFSAASAAASTLEAQVGGWQCYDIGFRPGPIL